MAKKPRPAAQPNPAIRLSSLRPKLAALFATPPLDAAALSQLTDGLKPASFLPILVGTFADSPAADRAQLDAAVGAWLREQGHLAPLRDLEARQTFEGAAREAARAWLETGGIQLAPDTPVEQLDRLLAAYQVGDSYQASYSLFWLDDPRRKRVRMASLLVDFQPPWEGAVKDIAYHTFRDFTTATDEYFALWRRTGMPPRPIDAAEASRLIWTALGKNYAEQIRLPADLLAEFETVMPMLYALPAVPEAPPLGEQELLAVTTHGRSPEGLRTEERFFGYQTRLDDGSIIRILRPSDDEEL